MAGKMEEAKGTRKRSEMSGPRGSANRRCTRPPRPRRRRWAPWAQALQAPPQAPEAALHSRPPRGPGSSGPRVALQSPRLAVAMNQDRYHSRSLCPCYRISRMT
eukprot:359013-Pyramimonas_sp.AAC.1